MRIAIVHHWFVSQGGGERVAEVFAEMFPEADVFALITDPKFIPAGLGGRHVTASFLQRIPGAKRFHRHLLPLYPLAVEQLDLTGYDLIISSDSGPMKGVLTNPSATHICYCHSPMRYVWDGYHSYLREMPSLAKVPFALAAHYVRNWDYMAAQRVTRFVANSNYVAGRIARYYGRESTVLYPPVDTERGFIANTPGDYYLAVGRMVPYKHTEILIEACNRLRAPLHIVGSGPELARLRAMAGPTIKFLGALNNDDLWQTYAHARALLFAAEEDFGIVPLESQACGRPVIAYGKGGSLETVRGHSSSAPGQATGVFFSEQTPESVMEGIRYFESVESDFTPEIIRKHAQQFDTAGFIHRMQQFLAPWHEAFSSKLETGFDR
ncbi:MAG: glycosyltransferase [Acidobacteriaceae bacterium]|nr:glycosyltransferase [Acidobacteriaceae bacterium]